MTTPAGRCPHVHSTGITCPDPAGHTYDHGLPHGCTECNFAAPEPTDAGRTQFLRDLFDAYGAPLPEPRLMTALAQALAASWAWGNTTGYNEGLASGWDHAIATIRGDHDEPPEEDR